MLNSNNQDVGTILAEELLKEKRRERFWRNIRFISWFALFAYSLVNIFHPTSDHSLIAKTGKKYVALIRLNGMIAPESDVSAKELIPVLQDAFRDQRAVGVVIDINSPGGTPVQSAILHDTILDFKKRYHKSVTVVGEDLLASGAYYVAVAADKIYVNANTLTGSIGVIMKGFGFVDAIKKLGVERRVYTAGNDKDRLDPFLPQSPDDIQKIKEVMNVIHENFKQIVLEGRKGKLHANPETLFTGDFWSGDQALQLGLVDGLGNLLDVMEKEYHTTEYKEYGNATNLIKLLTGQLNSAMSMLF